MALKDALSKGANVNGKDEKNSNGTAAMYAAGNGRLECLQALISAGADLNLKNVSQCIHY